MDTISKQVAQIESIIPQSALITDIEEAEQVLKEIQENDFSNRFRLLLKINQSKLLNVTFKRHRGLLIWKITINGL